MALIKKIPIAIFVLFLLSTASWAQQAPVLNPIGAQSVDEGTNLNVGISATDPDLTTPTLAAENIPTNATFTDNLDGTGTFDFNPDFTQSGAFDVTFIASDGSLSDTEIVTITVNNVNLAPVLSAIGAQSVDEGANLNVGISATDPDLTIPSLTAENIPTNAMFTDNLDGTGTFNFDPDYTQSNTYDVTFIASDGALADSEIVTITVNNVNLAPILSAIGTQSVDEGANLNVGISATDADGTTPTLTAENIPTNAMFTDNLDGTGTFNFDPDYTQSNTYDVTFIASDGALADSEIVTITVNHVNLAPVLTSIGAQSVDEGANLNVVASATDADGTTPTMSAVNVPTNATFTDNLNGTGTFDFNPDYTQSGAFDVTFIASDGSLSDTEIVTITVNNVNLAPVLAAIGAQSVDEGANLNVGISATDPDGTTPAMSAVNVPTNATFTDNLNGTGTFDFNPDYTQSGAFDVTFIASDGALADSEIVTITVNHVNLAPVLAAIGAQSVDEGANLNVVATATDADGTTPAMSAVNVPTNATFTDNLDGTGTFDFNPDYTQSGSFDVTFIASDGALADSEIVTITVNHVNLAPVLAAIGAQSVDEGANLNIGISATDPDLTTPTLTAENIPTNATFTDNLDGTGTFDFNPDYTQSGSFDVTFIASDGALADSEIVTITVNHVNLAPVLAAIGAQSVDEGANLNVGISATDADGTTPTMSAVNVPTNATFTDNLDGTGTFDFNPDYTQSNTYDVTFIASDGALADSEIVTITVNQVNLAPVLTSIGAQSVDEGANLNVGVSATDADGTTPTLTAENIPTNATFTDNLDGTGTFNFNPDYTQSGAFDVTFIASDGVLADSEIVTIIVNHVNLAPILSAIGAQSVDEGANLNVGITTTDADGTTPILTAVNVPTNATFIDNLDGTGTFDFNPDYTQSGNFDVTFIASDGSLSDTEIVTITVNHVNLAPVLAAIGSQSTTEGIQLTFGISATDFDLDVLTLTTSALPGTAGFIDNGNGTGTFDWTPDYTDAGIYDVTFYVDDGALTDSEIVTITIIEAGNQPPVLNAIGPQSTTENVLLTFTVTASDLDETIPTLTTSTLPGTSTFIDNGDGSGTFNWTPSFTDANTYNVTFYASDGIEIDGEVVTITVNEAGNQAPVLASIGAQSVDEGANLNFGISTTDLDLTTPTLTAVNIPTNATFTDNLDGTGTFDFNPDYTQSNTYDVTFIASDGSLSDTEIVTITVNHVNLAPILSAIGAQSVDEGANLNVVATASDFDGTTPIMSAENIPTNATFTDNLDGTGTFDFNPDYTQSNTYDVTFIASDGALADSEIVTITVNNVNLAPVLTSIGAQSVDEGANLNVGISATDPDLTTPTLTAENIPTNATFTDNLDGTGTIDFNPDYTQANTYDVTFIASDGALSDTEIVTITVNHVNLAPVLAAIGAQLVDEGSNLNVGISATDPDLTTPTLTAENIPTNATFTDNLDGTGTFDFNPDYTQSNTYDVTFIASDGALSDTEIVTITVNHVNLTPVISAIGAQSTTEGIQLIFGVSSTDFDLDALTLTTSALPGTASFIDNGDGTGSFDWTPLFIDAGIYDVTFYAYDGALTDSEIVTITIIEAGNQPPEISPIDTQTTTEDVQLTFIITAADPDSTIPTLSASNLPGTATFVDNLDGTGTFDWTPNFTDSGSYDVSFFASDGIEIDGKVVTVVVNESGNQAPVLASIGAQSVDEGVNLNFGISASDADGTTPTLTAENIPTNATFTDNLDGTGTFDFNPDYTQSGGFDVTFIASDGSLSDTEIVTITVNHVNLAPILTSIGAQSVDEGVNLNFGISATDADLTTPTLTAENIPTNATFTDNLDGTGTFDFNPDFTQGGVYNVTFIASDGVLSDTEIVAITVGNSNLAPVLVAIGAQSVDEGANLNFGVSATDFDGTIPTMSAVNVPTNATFTDNLDGTGTFDFNPDYTQSNTYDVTFIASDGVLADSEIVTITVNHVNLAPELATIGAQSVDEGANLNFGVSATDADGTTPILTAENIPTNATFTDNLDGTGTFDFNPDFTQGGVYNVTFIASDGVLSDTEIVAITVGNSNLAPVLVAIGAQSVDEGANLNVGISATDADLTTPILTAENIPTNATFTDNLDGTGTFDFNPDYTQSGGFDVTFIASDGSLSDTEIVTITVNNVNLAPVLTSIGAQSVDEGANLNVGISATDADLTTPILTAENIPTNATFTDNLDGTGTFDFNPDYTQSGGFDVTFIASDGSLSDTEIVTITVNHVNLAPELAAIGAQSVDEGANLNFGISALDADGTTPTLTAENIPTNATFTDNLDGTGTFDFNPDYTQSGNFDVTFIASDGLLSDTEIVTITVNNVNLAPVLTSIGAQSVDEGANLNVGISATDADGTTPTLTAENIPTNATFTDNLDGTGTFDFNPDYTQSGNFDITFIASDGALADSEIVTITVNHVNLAPVLATIGAQSVDEGANLNFGVSATDFDGTIPTMSAVNVPTNGTFTDNLDGTGIFDFNPDFTQGSIYNVSFIASDGVLSDTEIVAITVGNSNLTPIADAGPDQFDVPVSSIVTLDGTGSSDPDIQPLTFDWLQISGPLTALSDPADSVPTFNPPLPGTYQFELIVSDGSLFSNPDTVDIIVINVASPEAITDLIIAINVDAIDFAWSEITLDTDALPTTIDGYIIYRNSQAYFTPTNFDSIGVTDAVTFNFTDNNIGGADVVGDTLTQYFYVVVAFDIYGNRSAVSNIVGEYDYQLVTATNSNYNLICVPFENSGITTADDLINAIGVPNVLTVNNYQNASQSFESRFAAGFGVNFTVNPGGVYQINAATESIFSVAGNVPFPSSISYELITTSTTNYSFIVIPFELESSFSVAQDVIDTLPGSFNTLNQFITNSQSYESRFAAGFGVNFTVKAGKPYQANSAVNDIFPGP